MTRPGRVEMTALMERAFDAATRAGAISVRSRDLVAASRSLRTAGTGGQRLVPRFFVVHGEIEGEAVRASWFRGSLRATGALLSRMQLLVDLEEEFTTGPGRDGPVMAGLENPGPAMLTSVRACDRVRMVRFGPLQPAAPLPTF